MSGQGDYMPPDSNPNNQVVPRFTGRSLSGSVINLGQNKQMIRQETFLNVMSPALASQQQIQTFEVNIGLDEMFPMGSQFANNYRKYRITQLAFTYKNMLPQSQTTTQVGQVSLTWNPDVGEENDMTTNMQIANDQSSVNCNANEDVTLFCEMDPARGAPNQFLNIRNKALRTTQDPSDFDVGVLTLTLAGFPVTTAAPPAIPLPYQIGRLVVSYCCELQHETINTAMGSSIDTDLFLRGSSAGTAAPGTFFDIARVLKSENNVGCLLSAPTVAFPTGPQLGITFPATAFGYYQIEFFSESQGLTVPYTPISVSSAPQIFLSSNGTVGPVFDLLNTSSGTSYSTPFTGACVAPTGAAIVAPGDPYCYGNGTWSWDPQSPGPVIAAGAIYRSSYVFHVYVPGVSSNSAAQLFAAASSSPIQLLMTLALQTFSDIVPTANTVATSKWALRITEMNATMRLKLNGTQDQPYTTNFAGVPTLLTAGTW